MLVGYKLCAPFVAQKLRVVSETRGSQPRATVANERLHIFLTPFASVDYR